MGGERDRLSEQIHLLGDLLGQTIVEQEGEPLYELVEEVRGLAKLHRAGDDAALSRIFFAPLPSMFMTQTVFCSSRSQVSSHLLKAILPVGAAGVAEAGGRVEVGSTGGCVGAAVETGGLVGSAAVGVGGRGEGAGKATAPVVGLGRLRETRVGVAAGTFTATGGWGTSTK